MAQAQSQAVRRGRLLALVLCLVAAVSWAQSLEWNALTADQRNLLAPWTDDWASFPPERQKALADLAARHPAGSEQYRQLQMDITRYANMLEHERARIIAKYREFKSWPAGKQQEYMRAWLEYDRLPQEEKDTWRREGQPPRQAQ